MVRKILFITLSNIGDAILSLPALDLLMQEYPQAGITCLAGERTQEIFVANPRIEKVIVYNKRASLKEQIKLFGTLRKQKFDLVVDLRNTFFGVGLPVKYKAPYLASLPKKIMHMKDKHLHKLQITIHKLQTNSKFKIQNFQKSSLYIKPEDEQYIKKILQENNINKEDTIIVISAGARSHTKRWPQDNFVSLADTLKKEFAAKVVLVGDKDDAPVNRYISAHAHSPILDLSAKTTLTQLACLLKKVRLLITNDSAVLHLASYLEVPVVAIFGPTDEKKYGPWSEVCAVVKKQISCRPCQKAQCRFATLECLRLVKVEDVLRQVRNVLVHSPQSIVHSKNTSFKRILIVRTDRVGDVLLSTPVIKALREEFPSAYIAMMVSPYAKDAIEGNPYLDEVIVYDKDGRDKSWFASAKFALSLRKKKFDLALVLHPTNRVHLVTFFSGIPRRIGYDRKMGFLLSDRIKHTKQHGEKHELEYNLDLVRYLGIEPQDKTLFIPLKKEAEQWAADILGQEGITARDKLLALHPAASCPSKIWPQSRFAQVADRLADKYAFKVILIAGPKDMQYAAKTIKAMHKPAINLAGKLSVSQLASILKRCTLFISNDSGPVHIASAVGTPVISIFGRKQPGLSPRRWGPVGRRDKFLHKDAGCIRCRAHNCVKEFACLKAITVDDVLAAAQEILGSP